MHGKEFEDTENPSNSRGGVKVVDWMSPNKLIKKDQPKFGMVKMGWVKKPNLFGR